MNPEYNLIGQVFQTTGVYQSGISWDTSWWWQESIVGWRLWTDSTPIRAFSIYPLTTGR